MAASPMSRPGAAPNLAGLQAASVRLPLCFVLAGVLSLFLSAGAFLAEPDLLAVYHYTPHTLAITHLFVLGFICSVIMGAMYQLVPVTLETRLFSEGLVLWQFFAHAIGVVGMVWSFWVFNMTWVAGFGSLFGLGVVLFVVNLAGTLARVKGWNVIKTGIASALFWLALTVAAGLLLALSQCWGFMPFAPMAAMHAHAHLGVIGFFLMLIVTVSFKLVPMFALGELKSKRRAAWSLALLNGFLPFAFLAILFQNQLKPLAALGTMAGLALYALEIIAILQGRNRRRLDWGLLFFLTGLALLLPLCLLALVLCCPRLPMNALALQLESVYGLLALVGVVGMAILGMLYKIVPFLVWFHAYSPHIGRAKVPALAGMYSVPVQIAGYWSFLAGLAVLCVATALSNATAIRLGAVLLDSSMALFAFNLTRMLSHWFRPRIAAFQPKPPQGAHAP